MLRLRFTAGVSALVIAGAIGMAWWMSAWPRLHDRPVEAAVAARQHTAQVKPRRAATHHRVRQTASSQAVVVTKPAPPSPVYAPSPAYPMQALREDRGGVVTLRVSVDGRGTVTAVDIARSSGHAALDASARKTMHQWRFHAPANGQPMTFDYPVRFRIGK